MIISWVLYVTILKKNGANTQILTEQDKFDNGQTKARKQIFQKAS